MSTPEEDLIEVHHRRIAALVSRDLEALEQIVGQDLVFVNANGRTMRRPEIFAAFKAGTMAVRRIDSSDIEVRLYGDTAILAYRALTTVQDGDNLIDGLTQNTCVFVHRDGRWQMVNQHQCAVTG